MNQRSTIEVLVIKNHSISLHPETPGYYMEQLSPKLIFKSSKHPHFIKMPKTLWLGDVLPETHISQETEQDTSRWCRYSGLLEQKLHLFSCAGITHFLRSKSLVFSLPRRASHMKESTSGGVKAQKKEKSYAEARSLDHGRHPLCCKGIVSSM